MRKWQRVALLAVLFLVSVGVFAGLKMYFSADKDAQADTSNWVSITEVGNSGFVITEDDPADFVKDDDEDIGSEKNPFTVIEIMPNPYSAQIGWMIAGAEPIDINEAIDNVDYNAGRFLGSEGTGAGSTSVERIKFYQTDYLSETTPSSGWNNAAWQGTTMLTGYLRRLKDSDKPKDHDGVLRRYSVKGYKSSTKYVVGYKAANKDTFYYLRFKYVGADYAGDEPRFSVDEIKTSGWQDGWCYEEVNGHYEFKDYGTGNNAQRLCPTFKADENGEYIIDKENYPPVQVPDGEKKVNEWDGWMAHFQYGTTADSLPTDDINEAEWFAVEKDPDGPYIWIKDSTSMKIVDRSGNNYRLVEQSDVDFSSIDDQNKDLAAFAKGKIDRYYAQMEYTPFNSYSSDYHAYHKFLIDSIGLASDCGLTPNYVKSQDGTYYKVDGYKYNGELFKYNGMDTKYPPRLATAIKNYHIGVKTLTPEELAKHPEWIDKADLVYFGQSTSYGYEENVDKYARDPKLRGHWSDYDKSKKVGGYYGKNDLSWESVEHIMNRCIVQRMAGIIMDITQVSTAMENSPSQSGEIIYQFSMANQKLTNWRYISNNDTHTGYCNNYFKMCQMMLCMDQQTFVNHFWKTGLIQKTTVTVDGKPFETGSFILYNDAAGNNNHKEDSYWSKWHFMPCNYNAKTKKNIRGTAQSDWHEPDGAIWNTYKSNWQWDSHGGSGIIGQVVLFNNTTALSQSYDKPIDALHPSRVDLEAAYIALGWTLNPETGEWTGPDGRTELTDDDLKHLTMQQGHNYVIRKPFTPPSVGSTFEVLDIEASNWFEVDAAKYSDRIDAELLMKNRVEKVEDFLSLETGMTVNVTYVTPDTLNAMTNNFADDYDLIIIGDSVENTIIKADVEDSAGTLKINDTILNKDGGAVSMNGSTIKADPSGKVKDTNNEYKSVVINAANLDNYTTDGYIYSHNGKNGYAGNDITKKTLRKLEAYMNAGNAVLIWEVASTDSMLKTGNKTINGISMNVDRYTVSDKVDPDSNMYTLLTELAEEAKEFDIEEWMDYTRSIVAGVGDRDDDVSIKQYMSNNLQHKMNTITNRKGHAPSVMTVRNLLYLINQYNNYTNTTQAGTLNKAIKNYYADIVYSWYNTMMARKPEIVFTDVPAEYKGAVTKDKVDSQTYITIDEDTTLEDVLNFSFQIQGVEGVYDATLYVDFDANGNYTEAEKVATASAIQVKAQSGGITVGSSSTTTVTRYTSDVQQFRYENFGSSVKSFFDKRVGGFTWKIAVSHHSTPDIIETENIVTTAIKRKEKETLRILQLVPDDASKRTLDIQDSIENGWMKEYTKDLVDYYIVPTTMTVSEFESLYDTQVTSKVWTTKIETSRGVVKYRIKDTNRLTYNPDNIKTDRLAQFGVVILGFSKEEFPSINNTYGALDNLLQYIRQGNSLIVGSDIMGMSDSTELLQIPANIPDRITETEVASQAALAAGASIGSGSIGELDGGSGSGGTGGGSAYAMPRAAATTERLYPNGYVYNKLLRSIFGQNRYGKTMITDADNITITNTKYIKTVERKDTGSDKNGYSYKYLKDNGSSVGNPFRDSAKNNDKITASATMVNDNGQLACYPYKIMNDYVIDDAVYDGTDAQAAVASGAVISHNSFRIAESYAQQYQLYLEDMTRDDAGRKFTSEDTDVDDVVVWATLEGTNDEHDAYESSPKNATNNYYLYAKGNIFYIGIGQDELEERSYEWTMTDDEVADSVVKEEYSVQSNMERMLFINTIIAAYSRARDLAIEVPDAYEVRANDFYYYLKTDDIDNIMNYEDDDYEYILFRVSDSKSVNIATTVKFEDNTETAYPYKTDADGNILTNPDGSIQYQDKKADGTAIDPVKLEVYEYFGDEDSPFDKANLKDANGNKHLITKEPDSDYAIAKPHSSGKAYKLRNNQLYAIKYQKKLVNNPEKDKLVVFATRDGNKSTATISIMSKGYFQLD